MGITKRVANALPSVVEDIVGIAALGVTIYGIWLVLGTGFACIIGGLLVIGLLVLNARRAIDRVDK